mmetsp:Transcript_29165/g.75051  ORF Transcript_29165/g.75051 Transcript_29165/m.75051 type:complete len:222 (-) Transcript_29165:898-1563(-)
MAYKTNLLFYIFTHSLFSSPTQRQNETYVTPPPAPSVPCASVPQTNRPSTHPHHSSPLTLCKSVKKLTHAPAQLPKCPKAQQSLSCPNSSSTEESKKACDPPLRGSFIRVASLQRNYIFKLCTLFPTDDVVRGLVLSSSPSMLSPARTAPAPLTLVFEDPSLFDDSGFPCTVMPALFINLSNFLSGRRLPGRPRPSFLPWRLSCLTVSDCSQAISRTRWCS